MKDAKQANLADMTPEERVDAFYDSPLGLAAFVAALRDADRTRECPECGRWKDSLAGPGQIVAPHPDVHQEWIDCPTCNATGRITREKWALLKAAEALGNWPHIAYFLRNFTPDDDAGEETPRSDPEVT